jgi:hypothetical protein
MSGLKCSRISTRASFKVRLWSGVGAILSEKVSLVTVE